MKLYDQDPFEKYQTQLLYLVNDKKTKFLSRLYLRNLLNNVPYNQEITKLTKNGHHIYQGKGQTRATIYTRSEYELQLQWVLEALRLKKYISNPFKLWTAPDPYLLMTGSSPVTINSSTQDGDIYVINATYSTARNASTGTVENVAANSFSLAYAAFDATYIVERAFYPFDIASNVPAGNVASAATLSFAGNGNAGNNTNSSDIAIVESTQAAEILVGDDYNNFNTTELCTRMAMSSWVSTAGNYNDFTINASGITLINAAVGGSGFAGFAKYCGVSGKNDLDGNAPTGYNNMVAFSSDNATTKPQLVVTYAASGGAFLPHLGLLGVG